MVRSSGPQPPHWGSCFPELCLEAGQVWATGAGSPTYTAPSWTLRAREGPARPLANPLSQPSQPLEYTCTGTWGAQHPSGNRHSGPRPRVKHVRGRGQVPAGAEVLALAQDKWRHQVGGGGPQVLPSLLQERVAFGRGAVAHSRPSKLCFQQGLKCLPSKALSCAPAPNPASAAPIVDKLRSWASSGSPPGS